MFSHYRELTTCGTVQILYYLRFEIWLLVDKNGCYKYGENRFCEPSEIVWVSGGVKNAPAVFQRLMQSILTNLKTDTEPEFVDVYFDDIIVFSQTMDEHIYHLKQILEYFKANLKLNLLKC